MKHLSATFFAGALAALAVTAALPQTRTAPLALGESQTSKALTRYVCLFLRERQNSVLTTISLLGLNLFQGGAALRNSTPISASFRQTTQAGFRTSPTTTCTILASSTSFMIANRAPCSDQSRSKQLISGAPSLAPSRIILVSTVCRETIRRFARMLGTLNIGAFSTTISNRLGIK